MIDSELAAQLEQAGIIAVVTFTDPADAVPTARALVDGGVTAIELTLRTPAAMDAMHAVARDVPEMILGAGTVLTVEQLDAVKAAGARFAVAPGFNPKIVEAANRRGFPFAPGVMTPSDIEGAVALGNIILKFYHAAIAGGLPALKAMTGPYSHLGLRYIPLGGVSQENLAEWLAEPAILAAGGSWIAPPAAIESADWRGIADRARLAAEVVRRLRPDAPAQES